MWVDKCDWNITRICDMFAKKYQVDPLAIE
jgi:hypothetical protein